MIFSEVQIFELPSLLYRERAKMPRIGALYLVIEEDDFEILYIGQTGNLWERMKTHNRRILDTHRIYWKSIETKAERVVAERESIAALQPTWNGDLWSDW